MLRFPEMLRRGWPWAGLAALLFLLATVPPAHADGGGEMRALWVVRSTMTTPERVERMVRRAKLNGVKSLFVQVRGRADAYYRSNVEPRAEALEDTSFDPLALCLRLAHEQGMEVHAWLNVFLIWSAEKNPRDPSHLANSHPDWLAVMPDGHSVYGMTRREFEESIVEGMYLAPGNPDVRAEFIQVARDVLANYAVDGIQLDYVRYPSAETGYDFASRAEFMRVTGVDPAWIADRPELLRLRFGSEGVDDLARRWSQWKMSSVTQLVEAVRQAITELRPGAKLSAATISDLDAARGRNRQDWPMWLKRGLIDFACPMIYTPDDRIFHKQLARILVEVEGKPVIAGVGVYDQGPWGAARKMLTARRMGAAGIALFSYDAIENEPSYWQSIRRAYLDLE